MREILFRGKPCEYNYMVGDEVPEWVYGNGICEDEGRMFVVDILDETYKEIYPETVGQYTGLQDKNGKRIFEGDILESVADSTFSFAVKYGEYGERNDSLKTHIGFYCDWISCHGLNPLNGLVFHANKYKIVGNIHNNPELLKKQKE